MDVSKCWKIVEFPEISIKRENCKTFCKVQTVNRNHSVSSHPTPNQIKFYYVSRTKIFLWIYTEIYRHLLSMCFKNAVLKRPEMVQCKCIFWAETFYSFLVTRSFLLVTRYFLLVNRSFLLVTRYFLLVTFYSILVSFYSLFVTFYLLLVTF